MAIEAKKKADAEKGVESDVADYVVVRLEQLAPLCWEPIYRVISQHRKAAGGDIPILWVQEEPKNMGAWSFIRPRFNDLLKYMDYSTKVQYVGRAAAAAPAPGHGFMYDAEEKAIMEALWAN